jgi:predicted nucleic acid-binding protein
MILMDVNILVYAHREDTGNRKRIKANNDKGVGPLYR